MGGDLDSGSFAFPKDQFLLSPSAIAAPPGFSAEFGATDDLTGTYDAATGQMSMSIPVYFRSSIPVYEPEPDQPDTLSCEVSGFTAELKTEGSLTLTNQASTFLGQPFVAGRDGALLGGWSVPVSSLADHIHGFNGTPDEVCQESLLLSDPEDPSEDPSFTGKFWMKGDVTVTDLVCPVGKTGTPPDCRNAPPAVTLKSVKKSVKAGKSMNLKLKIRNIADVAQRTKITFKSSNRRVKTKRSITVKVPAHGVVLTEVKVTATRKAKGKAKITASSAGGKSSVTLKVKKLKKANKKRH
jgi:hypothetical protein